MGSSKEEEVHIKLIDHIQDNLRLNIYYKKINRPVNALFVRHPDDNQVCFGPPNPQTDHPAILINTLSENYVLNKYKDLSITLCHELGHYENYLHGTFSQELRGIIFKFNSGVFLKKKAFRMLFIEEWNAWMNGAKTNLEFGVSSNAEYASRMLNALHAAFIHNKDARSDEKDFSYEDVLSSSMIINHCIKANEDTLQDIIKKFK